MTALNNMSLPILEGSQRHHGLYTAGHYGFHSASIMYRNWFLLVCTSYVKGLRAWWWKPPRHDSIKPTLVTIWQGCNSIKGPCSMSHSSCIRHLSCLSPPPPSRVARRWTSTRRRWPGERSGSSPPTRTRRGPTRSSPLPTWSGRSDTSGSPSTTTCWTMWATGSRWASCPLSFSLYPSSTFWGPFLIFLFVSSIPMVLHLCSSLFNTPWIRPLISIHLFYIFMSLSLFVCFIFFSLSLTVSFSSIECT